MHGGDTPAEREAKTSSTTSQIQGGCTTIYNLAGSLLCDRRGESESGAVDSRAEEKTIVFNPPTEALKRSAVVEELLSFLTEVKGATHSLK